jgi:hypothetical protein
MVVPKFPIRFRLGKSFDIPRSFLGVCAGGQRETDSPLSKEASLWNLPIP